MSCAFHQTSKSLVQCRYMNANRFGNFSLGVSTSGKQFHCLPHLFLGPQLNSFILMSTVGVPFDSVLFLPLYSFVLMTFLAMFNLGRHTIKEKHVSRLSCLANWVVVWVSRLLSRSVFHLNTALLDTLCTQKWK